MNQVEFPLWLILSRNKDCKNYALLFTELAGKTGIHVEQTKEDAVRTMQCMDMATNVCGTLKPCMSNPIHGYTAVRVSSLVDMGWVLSIYKPPLLDGLWSSFSVDCDAGGVEAQYISVEDFFISTSTKGRVVPYCMMN